jgi:hypothetical protein
MTATQDHATDSDESLWRFWNTKARGLLARAEAAEADRDALRKALAQFANASRIELVGLDGRRVYCTKAELYHARTLLAGDNHE